MIAHLTNVGNWFLFLAAAPALLSVAVFCRVDWWRSAWGRHLMAYMASVALVLALGVLRLFIHDTRLFAAARLTAFAMVTVALWWRLFMVARAYREGPLDVDVEAQSPDVAEPARPQPGAGAHLNRKAPTMTADALTVAPSLAELRVAYVRKLIITFAPVLLAASLVLYRAATDGALTHGITWLSFVLAASQAAAVAFPNNAVAKLVWSLLAAVASALVAVVTHGATAPEIILVAVQFFAWASAGAVSNGARPDVAARVLGVPADSGPVAAL